MKQERIVVEPFPITYDGNDAESHIIAGRQLGESVIGASKLYAATAHYCVHGVVPRGKYRKEFDVFVLPAHEKCFEYHVVVAAIAAEYGLHGHLYKAGLKYLFGAILKVIKDFWLKPGGNEKVVSELVDLLKAKSKDDHELHMVLANGINHANDNFAKLHEKLIDTIPKLANSTRSHGADLVAPVGNTCKTLTQFEAPEQKIVINEVEAEVIRGGTSMEIDEMAEFLCTRISEINIETGHCILSVKGIEGPVVGKISDPALNEPNNIYTKALNNQSGFAFSAKSVKKDGEVKRLYVSDARNVN